jgi:hypothetical protein
MDRVKRGTKRREAIEEQQYHTGGVVERFPPYLMGEEPPVPWMHQQTVIPNKRRVPVRMCDGKAYAPAPPGRKEHGDDCWCVPCVRERAEKIIEEMDTQ